MDQFKAILVEVIFVYIYCYAECGFLGLCSDTEGKIVHFDSHLLLKKEDVDSKLSVQSRFLGILARLNVQK